MFHAQNIEETYYTSHYSADQKPKKPILGKICDNKPAGSGVEHYSFTEYVKNACPPRNQDSEGNESVNTGIQNSLVNKRVNTCHYLPPSDNQALITTMNRTIIA